MTLSIAASTLANNNGQEQKRVVTFQGDEMRVINPSPTVGGGTAYILYQRAK